MRRNFYPRSPCGERPIAGRITLNGTKFLSTLSLRRATPADACSFTVCQYFYPRSPCGERPADRVALQLGVLISIHALLAESDFCRQPPPTRWEPFLSTLSLRRATLGAPGAHDAWHISIHALLAESDKVGRWITPGIAISIHALLAESDPAVLPHPARGKYFYPRSPCGERQRKAKANEDRYKFLSTLSLRRATLRVLDGSKSSIISIHALLAESDIPYLRGYIGGNISIHALLAESDVLTQWCIERHMYISIHALLAESDNPWAFLQSTAK